MCIGSLLSHYVTLKYQPTIDDMLYISYQHYIKDYFDWQGLQYITINYNYINLTYHTR